MGPSYNKLYRGHGILFGGIRVRKWFDKKDEVKVFSILFIYLILCLLCSRSIVIALKLSCKSLLFIVTILQKSNKWCGSEYLIKARTIFLAGGVTNFSLFNRSSLKWPFNELFFSDALLWNQYNFIAFDIFFCKISIISYKMLIIAVISNETTNMC